MQQKRTTNGASGLERDFVCSQEVYDRETNRVFSSNWICIARIEELNSDSQILPVEFENHKLVVVRDNESQVRTFRNFCRHRGSHLVTNEDCGNIGQRIQCPYHAWTYDRSGQLVSAPNMDGVEDFDPADFGLIEVPTAYYGGFVWICFSPQQSLTDFLAPLASNFADWELERLRIAAEIRYEVRANWKLIFQNYNECYHCPMVHPTLNRLTPYKDASNDLESGAILGGPMRLAEGTQTMSQGGNLAGRILPELDATQARSVYYYTIFPSLFFSPHPDYVLIHRIERLGIGRTRVTCQWLFDPDVISRPGFNADSAIQFWDMTNRQDWKVCELAQTGMGDAGYTPGPYSNLESVVAAFDRHYKSEMDL